MDNGKNLGELEARFEAVSFSNFMSRINELKNSALTLVHNDSSKELIVIRLDQIVSLVTQDLREAMILKRVKKKEIEFDYGTSYRPEKPLFLTSDKNSDERFTRELDPSRPPALPLSSRGIKVT